MAPLSRRSPALKSLRDVEEKGGGVLEEPLGVVVQRSWLSWGSSRPYWRPPSRQRHPFPQHLADFRHGSRRPVGEPQAFSTEASQVENTKEHIKATKKLADRQRPGTRKVS